MRFESPWALLVLLVIPVVVYFHFRRRRRAGVKFSSTDNAGKAGVSLRQRLISLAPALRIIALVLIALALARPQEGKERVRDVSKGIAIQMVVDRSSSMSAEMRYRGDKLNRLEAVKAVFEEFVNGNGDDLPGRPDDLIGMIIFARYADTVCPLTLSHGAVSEFLRGVDIVKRRSEDGTAIGDAVALAAARLKTAEETLNRQAKNKIKEYEIKSKIIILLTDGENNAGKRTPRQAGQLAAKWGIKIYTVAVGGGEAYTTIQTPFGSYKVPVAQRADTSELEDAAETTGGIFRMATDEKSLRAVYEEIDKLEKSEIESLRFLDYRELFGLFALAGLVFIALEAALSCTVFRRIP